MTSLNEIDAWMKAEIGPKAEAMDANSDILFETFKQLGDRNLLALGLSPDQGGQGWDEQIQSEFQILIASHSGALAFLTTQHQSALRMISRSDNTTFKSTQISTLIQGTIGMGVGFSQLRRPGPPMMTAIEEKDGYRLSGVVPWVTGFGCFKGFICGARLPNQDILMGWVPLLSIQNNPRYQISSPLALTAMASTQTVEVRFDQWHLNPTDVIAIYDREWLSQKDQVNTLHHGFYALGAAKAALRLMGDVAPSNDVTIGDAIAALNARYQHCQQTMFDLLPHRQHYPAECLQAKAEAIAIAGRTAQAAIAVSGGRANNHHHPAQRIYREVLAFTVFGQTAPSKRATLAALSSF